MKALQRANINTIEKMAVGNGKKFAAKVGRFSALLGMKKLGLGLVELEPGKRAWPYHEHYGMEELFIILEGMGTIRYADAEYPIAEGDVIFTPTGEGTAHQIINTSSEKLVYLAFSSENSPELCFYPDSRKYGAYVQTSEGKSTTFLAHEDSAINYFDGEEDEVSV